MRKQLFKDFENGVFTVSEQTIHVSVLPWNAHKEFEGVYLKNIVTYEQTMGLFTCHLVRIEPGQKIGLHTHPTCMELHEVIAGGGKCVTERGEISYAAGKMALLPANTPHEVIAGENGLYLFAKFFTVPH